MFEHPTDKSLKVQQKDSRLRKVAFVSTMEAVPWGGSELLWARTATSLREAGVSVAASVMSWPTVPDPVRQLQNQGCQISFRTRMSRICGHLREKCKAGSYPAHWLSKVAPDLLVMSCGGVGTGVDWMETSHRLRIPYVVVNHLMFDEIWPDDQACERLAPALEQAVSCCFVSENLARETQKRIAKRLANMRVIRNPYNVGYDVEPDWPQAGDELRLAFVGRLDGSKGCDILFDVLAMSKWRERSVSVSLYGDGPNERGLRKLAQMLDLTSVSFPGYSADIRGVWSRHHALVLPSRLEAMPIVVVEAMLCGRPCVVTDVGGITEIVRDGRTGYVAVAPKACWVDQAMERLWQGRDHLQAMGMEARRRIRELVPPDPAQDFARYLIKVLSQPGQPDSSVTPASGSPLFAAINTEASHRPLT